MISPLRVELFPEYLSFYNVGEGGRWTAIMGPLEMSLCQSIKVEHKNMRSNCFRTNPTLRLLTELPRLSGLEALDLDLG